MTGPAKGHASNCPCCTSDPMLDREPFAPLARPEVDYDELPVHRPIAPEAPIPGRHWYGGCDPDGARVGADGVCRGCGEKACPVCGAGFYPDGGCECKPVAKRELVGGVIDPEVLRYKTDDELRASVNEFTQDDPPPYR